MPILLCFGLQLSISFFLSLAPEADKMTSLSDARIEEIFDTLDADNSGALSLNELGLGLRAAGFAPSNAQVEALVSKYDKDGSKTLSRDEFKTLCRNTELPLAPKKDDLHQAFRAFDADGSGKISLRELKSALSGSGEGLSQDEIKWMFQAMDNDGDGEVSIEEFAAHMGDRLGQKTTDSPTDLVRSTWADLTTAFTFQQIGDAFYGNLFAANPELTTTVFEGVDQKAQGMKLVNMIDAAVKILDDGEQLKPVLVDLGRRHAFYKTEEAHFPVVGAALLKTLGETLGDKWTPEVTNAWTAIYDVMSEAMIEGLRAGYAKKKETSE